MKTLFVTGAGTEVGKTFVMLRLIDELRAAGKSVRALKPIASGFDRSDIPASDTGLLLRAQGLAPTDAHLDAVSPWRFAAPLSPNIAAARERRSIPFTNVVEFCRESGGTDVTLIEGVGGVMVPLDEEHTVLDWIAALGAPALLVVGSYLGTLSHALTAALALQSRAVPLAGVIVSESREQPMTLAETAGALERHLRSVRIACLPRSAPTPRLLPWLAEHLG